MTEYFLTHWLETIGLLSGLLCVWLLIKQNIFTFPIGLVYALVTVVVVFNERLYSDVLLNFYYVLMNGYGWFYWLRGGQERRVGQYLKVCSIPPEIIKWVLLVVGLGTIAMGWFFNNYTNAELAYADSFTTVSSFVTMYLSAKKYLESWLLWVVIDVVQVVLYLLKGIELYAFLYLIYLYMAYVGWNAWKQPLNFEQY